jgi:hypothetical protein
VEMGLYAIYACVFSETVKLWWNVLVTVSIREFAWEFCLTLMAKSMAPGSNIWVTQGKVRAHAVCRPTPGPKTIQNPSTIVGRGGGGGGGGRSLLSLLAAES